MNNLEGSRTPTYEAGQLSAVAVGELGLPLAQQSERFDWTRPPVAVHSQAAVPGGTSARSDVTFTMTV